MAIESSPDILGGKPVVKDTRIPVDLLLELVEAGLSVDDIVLEYPGLTRGALLTVLRVAKDAHEMVTYEKLRSATEA